LADKQGPAENTGNTENLIRAGRPAESAECDAENPGNPTDLFNEGADAARRLL
jgi:hypothetical protein